MAVIKAGDFVSSIGVNTHVNFTWTSYKNTEIVINAINYLGVKNLRDSATRDSDLGPTGTWQVVADATGAKFNAYVPQATVTGMQNSLLRMEQLAKQNILNFIEGANEYDSPYPISQGNSLQIGAAFQQQVYALGQQYDLPVINMSFGQGWSKSAKGNYDKVGDISAWSDYANAHTYFGTGNPPNGQIKYINSLAQISSKNPVIVTELGWYTTHNPNSVHDVSEDVQAKYMMDALLDSYQAGSVKTYLYELLDQGTGVSVVESNFGLFYKDGTPKKAAHALHNMIDLLSDDGANAHSFVAQNLDYSLSGLITTDKSMLMANSDGSYWLAVWNEARLSHAVTGNDIVVSNHDVTLSLKDMSDVYVYDPLSGVSILAFHDDSHVVRLSVPDHPLLIKISAAQVWEDVGGVTIVDNFATAAAGMVSITLTTNTGVINLMDANGVLINGSGTGKIHFKATLDKINDVLESLEYSDKTKDNDGDYISIEVWNQVSSVSRQTIALGSVAPRAAPVLDAADSLSIGAGDKVHLSGLSYKDDWAAARAGKLALNLSTQSGHLSVDGVDYGSKIRVNATVDEINEFLSKLHYEAGADAGRDTIRVEIWNQAGVMVRQNMVVSVADHSYNDVLYGTAGDDLLFGGHGLDVFTHSGVVGEVDTVLDYSAGDVLDLHLLFEKNGLGQETISSAIDKGILTAVQHEDHQTILFDADGAAGNGAAIDVFNVVDAQVNLATLFV